jgi:O-antigen/teichoic acid export membrane protein
LIQLSGSVFGKGLSAAEIEKLRILLIIMSIHTAISFPLGVYTSAAVAYEQYLYNKLICIAETILAPVINLAILYAGYGAVGITAVGLPICILNALLYGVYCAKRLHVYPVFNNMPVYILKELVGFCSFIFLASIVDILYWATDKILIGAVLGTAAVAIYNIGGTFTSMLQNMAHAISNVFSTRVNMMVAKNSAKSEISELLIRVGRLQYLIVSLMLSGYITFGQVFICLWVGDSYTDAYWVALMTMVPLAVPLIQNIAFTTIVADNKHQFRSIVYAIIAVLNVVSTYLVLPRYGILGAAACTSIAFVLGQGIIMNIYYYHVTKLDIPAFFI